MNNSDVARLLEQIALEQQAAQRALTDFTETGKHIYLTRRQEDIAACCQELRKHVPPKQMKEILRNI